MSTNSQLIDLTALEALSSTLNASHKGEKKGSSQMLAELATLYALEQSLAKASDATAPKTPETTGGPAAPQITQMEYITAIALCAAAIATLQGTDAQARENEALCNASISSSTMTHLQAVYQQQIAALAQELKEEQEASSTPWWQKLIEAFTFVAAILTTAFSFGTGVAMLTVAILQYSGALSDITNKISSDLQADGLSAGQANIVADTLVTAMTVVATMGASGASLATIADDADSFGSQVASFLKSAAQKAVTEKQAIYAGIDGMAQGISSTSLIENIGQYIIQEDFASDETNPNKEQTDAIIMAVVQSLVTVLLSLVGAVGASASAANAEESALTQVENSTRSKIFSALPQKAQDFYTNFCANAENLYKYISESCTSPAMRMFSHIVRNYGARFAQNGIQTGVSIAQGEMYMSNANALKALSATTLNLGNIQAESLVLNFLLTSIQYLGQNQAQDDLSLQKSHTAALQSILLEGQIYGSAIAQATLAGV